MAALALKRANFQNPVVAHNFAEGCRQQGMKIAVIPLWRRDKFGYDSIVGFCVKWAPSWDEFQQDEY